MIGSLLTRGLVMVFGYAYPAYECYKEIEKNKPEVQQLRFWCQYWILVAALTIFERVGDTFASWFVVPLYCEAKLAFFIYLWFPKTRGTTYVYDSFFKPYVAKHEKDIDRNLVELRTKAGDMAVMYCKVAVCYGQTRFTEILHFVALQSTPKPQPKEKKQPAPKEEEQKQPDVKTSQAASTPQASLQAPKPKKPLLLTKETIAVKPTSSPRKQLQPQQQTETKEAQPSVSQTKLTPTPPPSPATKPNADSAQPAQSTTEIEKASEVVAAAIPATEIQRASSSKEAITEEALRVTRGSLRKARSVGNTLKEK
ncbi:unnamed protein product [Eruca vesicaria subsp. sativa]|uniref:HVA22-like protein n=1 Tax=Eruca vesicaria subsp. sativa TaxID=29727 RepID=A0ABC8LPV9_ERUVS|nr:unnamed protein product [Eruca vesicaria subsp. sativa]